jgi:hypothetical protein
VVDLSAEILAFNSAQNVFETNLASVKTADEQSNLDLIG